MLKFLIMMMQRFALICVGALVLSSCAHTPVKKTMMEDGPSPPVTGTVLDSVLLAQGGDLALAPFKAGSRAEADGELDRLSMMILKGIKDGIEEHDTSLHIIGNNEGQPKIVLEGYVQEYSKTSRLSRMMLRPNRDSLVLEGELWVNPTGERLLSFSTQRKFDPKKEKPKDVAYALGKDIGDFVGAHAK